MYLRYPRALHLTVTSENSLLERGGKIFKAPATTQNKYPHLTEFDEHYPLAEACLLYEIPLFLTDN